MKLKGKLQALIGASMVVWFFGSLVFGLFGMLSPMWQEMFSTTPAVIGLLMMIAMFAMGIFNPFASKIASKKGTRFTTLLSIILATLAILGFAIAQNIIILFPAGILLGFSGSLSFGPGLTCIQKWYPPKKAGMVSGIFNFCFGLSAAVMIPIYRALLTNLGYRTALFIIASIIFVIGLICSLFTSEPDMQPAPAGAGPAGAGRPMLPGFDFKEATATSSFKLLWLIWGMAGVAGIGLVTHIIKLSGMQGFTVAQGTTLMMFFNLFNAFIRIIVGPLSDKVNPKHLMWPVFLVAGIACCLLTTITNFGLAIVALSIIGMTTGIVFTITPVLVRTYFGMRAYGAIFGVVFSSYCFLSAFFGPFVGGLLSKTSYTPAVILFGAFLIISAILTIIVKAPKKPEQPENAPAAK